MNMIAKYSKHSFGDYNSKTLPHNVTHCSTDHGVESPEVDEVHECSLRDPICFLFSLLWRRMTNQNLCVNDRLGDQRGGGGSEWEPIKILLQSENSAYTPNSEPRIPTRVCQGHVVTTDLPTLGTNPNQSRSGRTTREAKDLAVLQVTRRTVRDLRADRPRDAADCSKNDHEPPVLHPQ
jgi:hypothetical protein